jgi:hypothetical protein
LRDLLLEPGLRGLGPGQGRRLLQFFIAQRFHFLEELDVDFHVAALARDVLGDLLNHVSHELGHGLQPSLGFGGPGHPSGGHVARGRVHAGLAAHATHHLLFEFGEHVFGNLAVPKLASLLFRQALDHATKEHRGPLHALERAVGPHDLGGPLRLVGLGLWFRHLEALFVDDFLEFLAGLEEGYALGRHGDRRAGFRVAPFLHAAVAQTKAAEAAYLDLIPFGQGRADAVEDRVDHDFSLPFGQRRDLLGQLLDELHFRHGCAS